MFGNAPDEKTLIDMKRDILEFLDMCKHSLANPDLLASIATNQDATECTSIGYALGMYINNKDARQACIGVLENVVVDSNSIAACMILMSIDKQNAAKWFDKLKANPSVWLYNNLLDRLAEYHNLDNTDAVADGNLTFWGRKNTNVQ